MSLSQAYGIQNMLKEGSRHFSGLEEALLRNINACKEIAKLTKSGLGPNGMKKMVINHLEKIFITSDAATIMKELEVQHPAAKMIVMAAHMQENECGDQTNFVIALAGELLTQAESLIKIGLHPSQIIQGYEAASKSAIDFLEKQSVFQVTDPTDRTQVEIALKSALSSKLYQQSDLFCKLVADACVKALPENRSNFDVEFIRVAKIVGAALSDSFVLKGLVVLRNSEGSITRVNKPKIACYGQSLDTTQSDTKGTVLINKADDLLNYTRSEEQFAENIVKRIAESGTNLVISGGAVSDLMLHYLEKYKIMSVRITSKFELKRICKAVGATPLARMDAPTPDEIGTCDEVYVTEIGSQKCTIIKRETSDCNLSTIILRGSTQNMMDDVERAIDDGVNVYRSLLKDNRFLPGAGSIEVLLQSKLEQEAKSLEDLKQYSYTRYAQSFEIIPRILAENAGLDSNQICPQLVSENAKVPTGISMEDQLLKPVSELQVYDHLVSKWWAIKLASDAAITILRIDQIIIAKPAGGPKQGGQQGNWDED